MLTNPPPLCGILYVDDEEMALKYFNKAFSAKFNVFTASSGAAGLEVLKNEAGRIGIVLSDQRMPEMLGAEFLGRVRQQYPGIVRILTTAYSDLESAIQAVNTGHIYQYVVKPWEGQDLGMVLQRAADYHRVLSERDQLLSVKMSTLQRVVCSDRVKWLLLSGRALDAATQPAFRTALGALVKAMPGDLPFAGAPDPRNFDIAALVRSEYGNASRCLDFMRFGAEPAQALQDFLSALDAALGLENSAASLVLDGAKASVTIPSSDRDGIVRALFGLLIERQTQEASVRFFEALAALAKAGGSLELTTGAGGAFSFELGTAAEAGDVIDALYENFSAADISRL